MEKACLQKCAALFTCVGPKLDTNALMPGWRTYECSVGSLEEFLHVQILQLRNIRLGVQLVHFW